VDIREIAPGLWYWTASHPEWEPGAEPDRPGDWPRAVGGVLAEVGGEPVLDDGRKALAAAIRAPG
jgi:hypothetical protein